MSPVCHLLQNLKRVRKLSVDGRHFLSDIYAKWLNAIEKANIALWRTWVTVTVGELLYFRIVNQVQSSTGTLMSKGFLATRCRGDRVPYEPITICHTEIADIRFVNNFVVLLITFQLSNEPQCVLQFADNENDTRGMQLPLHLMRWEFQAVMNCTIKRDNHWEILSPKTSD